MDPDQRKHNERNGDGERKQHGSAHDFDAGDN
jgi:hypothetical protein